MAADARVSTAFPQHPKTKKLARRLGPAGPLACLYLFLWTAANRTDGDLSGLSDEDLELTVDWGGEAGTLVGALAAVGFLDGPVGGREIHDWAEHNPWAAGAETRSAKARWNAIKRHHGETEANRMVPEWAAIRAAESGSRDAASNAASTRAAMLESNAPSPSPSPSQELEPADAGLSPAVPVDGAAGGDESDEKTKSRPPCPHQRIVALYHEILPELRKVREWGETRRRLLQRRWAEQPERQDLGWWREFFGYVRGSRFLMGQTTGRDSRPFDCDLEWLIRPTNFAKVVEGKYEDETA